MPSYKLVTFAADQGPRAGVVIGEEIYDAAKLTGKATDATMLGVLEDCGRNGARKRPGAGA
jgi:hypothetical protein